MREHLQTYFGLDLHILSGLQEADYTFKAIQNVIHWKDDSVMLVDWGGGGLEISIMEYATVLLQKSFNCGTHRLAKLSESSQNKHYKPSIRICKKPSLILSNLAFNLIVAVFLSM